MSKISPWLLKKKFYFLIVLAGHLMVENLMSFSLGSKILYLEKLKREAFQLKEQGYYDRSIELSRKIKDLSAQYSELIRVAKKWYQLQRRLSVAKQVKADEFAPFEYGKAIDLYKEGEVNIVDEDYPMADLNIDEGMKYAELAIEKSKVKFAEMQKLKIGKGEQIPEIEIVKVKDYYIVRLISNRRDCLWRIAEYAQIYNDPWKWKLIYQANRNIIKDPDLIYPGQKLVIPPEAVDFDEE